MSTPNPAEVIAEALAEHSGGFIRHDGDWQCRCGAVEVTNSNGGALAVHQASVIAALPDIAIVPRRELEVGGPKLAAIRDLHVRDQNGDWMCHEDECEACVYGNGHQGPIYSYCSDSTNEEHGVITWPCPTMQIIDGLPAPGLRLAAGGES